MRLVIELEAPDDLDQLSEEELLKICSTCAKAENQVRSFSMTVWSAKIKKEHERHPIKNSKPAPRSIMKKVVQEEPEDDDYISMDDFFES